MENKNETAKKEKKKKAKLEERIHAVGSAPWPDESDLSVDAPLRAELVPRAESLRAELIY